MVIEKTLAKANFPYNKNIKVEGIQSRCPLHVIWVSPITLLTTLPLTIMRFWILCPHTHSSVEIPVLNWNQAQKNKKLYVKIRKRTQYQLVILNNYSIFKCSNLNSLRAFIWSLIPKQLWSSFSPDALGNCFRLISLLLEPLTRKSL